MKRKKMCLKDLHKSTKKGMLKFSYTNTKIYFKLLLSSLNLKIGITCPNK